MKKLLPLFSLLLIFSCGCEDDKAETEIEQVDPLVGVWEMVSASLTVFSNPSQTITYNADANNSETMILGEDGVFSSNGKISGESFNDGGTWSSTGNKLSIITPEETMIIDYTLNGNTLTLVQSEEETEDDWAIEITVVYQRQS